MKIYLHPPTIALLEKKYTFFKCFNVSVFNQATTFRFILLAIPFSFFLLPRILLDLFTLELQLPFTKYLPCCKYIKTIFSLQIVQLLTKIE